MPAALSHEEEPGQSDDAIVAEIRKGNVDLFETLVARHEKMMLNIAFRMTGCYEDACEVVQDAFVSAYRNLKHFEGRSKFSTWLTSIVINLSKNRIGRTSAQKAREAYSLDDPPDPDRNQPRRDAASDAPDALRTLEQRETAKAVQDCIGRLDPEFREVIVLRDIRGFSYQEIGAVLTVAEGTVKSRLFRAREAVRDCLKKILGGI